VWAGCISLWTDGEDYPTKEDPSQHHAAISLLQWSPDGTRLITADKSGKAAVWGIANGRLAVMVALSRPQDSITHCIFRTHPNGSASAIPPFFLAGRSGMVTYADDNNCVDAFSVESPITAMLYHEGKDEVVLITKNVVLFRWRFEDGAWVQLSKMKLSVKSDAQVTGALWAGVGVLIVVTGESMLRIFDLDEDDNYILHLDMQAQGASRGADRAISASFSNTTGRLAAGTRDGRVFMWQYAPRAFSSASGSDNWEALPAVTLTEGVREVTWGGTSSLLGVSTQAGVSILSESVLCCSCVSGLVVMQQSAQRLYVEKQGDGKLYPEVLVPSINVKGCAGNGSEIVLWDGKDVEIFVCNEQGIPNKSGHFPATAAAIAVSTDSIFIVDKEDDRSLKAMNWGGTLKQTISLSDTEGSPFFMDVCGNFLALTARDNTVRIFNVGRRDAKRHGSTITFNREEILWQMIQGPGESPPPNKVANAPKGEIISARTNCTGQRVSIVANVRLSTGLFHPDNRIYIFDAETDTFTTHDFGHRYPVAHYWDPMEPRLLAVETHLSITAKKEMVSEGQVPDESPEICIFVSTAEHGITLQDSFLLGSGQSSLIGLNVPYLHFIDRSADLSKGDDDEPEGSPGGTTSSAIPRLGSRVMRDFKGMENIDDETKAALLDFSFHLTIGNMDAAYQAVKRIKSESVWENMAQMCVKTKRLDVAEVCVGNMGDARIAKALRDAKSEKELDARVGILALHLGLMEDAKQLFVGCERYDLLCELYQARGEWEKAIETADKYDRIHLKPIHFNHARFHEETGNIVEAIKAYEESNCHRKEVPRMLYSKGKIQELESYIMQKADSEMMSWWAQYCESKGQYDQALRLYVRADDYLAQVRVLCFLNDFDRALDVCHDTNDPAALYHLARQLEAQGQVREAVQLYSQAGGSNHAIRLARETGEMSQQVLGLAMHSTQPKLMVDSARHFEENGEYDQAVQLYAKAGEIQRALDLCFKAQLFSALRDLVEMIDADSVSPEMMARCGAFFMEHQQHDKAVHLYIKAGDRDQAIDLCFNYNILITEEMAEALTPDKIPGDEGEGSVRSQLLFKLAKCCKRQGNYHLACKKYTQAGDKIKAMKALIKSGDTEKITFFANVSRKKEIYIMAANYLQTLDWHNDQAIMKNIIQYYVKASALNSLSGFYEACSQVEIDEYRDYEKAFSALKEALKYMIKAKIPDKEERMQALQNRIFLVEKFVHARKLVKQDPEQMIKLCHSLLDTPDVEQGIRVGDVYALMVEYHHSQNQMQEGFVLIQRMRDARIILSPYLDREMIESIFRANGLDPVQDEELGEEIAEDDIGEEIQSD